MFDVALFLLLFVLALPGILVAVPRFARYALPDTRQAVVSGLLTNLIMVVMGTAVGTAAAPGAGLTPPFFAALTTGKPWWPTLRPQLLPALLGGGGGAVLLLGLYYGLFRPRLDADVAAVLEAARVQLGLAGRVLFGGVVDELNFRWGVMSLIAWLGTAVAGTATPVVMWGAIVVSGFLFSLIHLPGADALRVKRTPVMWQMAITLNWLVGLILGWLFWQVGLAGAMLAHALIHLIWHPIDRIVA